MRMGDAHLLWVTDRVSKFPTSTLSYEDVIIIAHATAAVGSLTRRSMVGGETISKDPSVEEMR